MNKKFLVVILGICALSACSNDERSSSPQTVVLNETCDSTNYVPTCIDDFQRKLCTSTGLVMIEICPENLACKGGYCGSLGGSNPENCSEPGCACSTISYRQSCNGNKRIACDDGIITEYNCADDGFICYQGECHPQKTTCSDNFKDKCIGNTLYYCNDYTHSVQEDNCGAHEDDGICATVNDVTSCYGKCYKEGDIYYNCVYDDYDDDDEYRALKYTCTMTDKGLLWTESMTTCHACYTFGAGQEFAENSSHDTICLSNECSDDSAADKCSSNHVVRCMDGYELDYDCGELECVIDADMGAICAEPCDETQANQHRYTCAQSEYSGIRSTDELCTQIGSKYYWLYQDTTFCSRGCNDSTGECTKLHPDEFKSCSRYQDDDNYYAEKCDDNIILSCSAGEVYAEPCGTKTCVKDPYYGDYECMKLCTAEEIANPTSVCEGAEYYTPGNGFVSYYSYKSYCEEFEPGKFIKIETGERCFNYCDLDTGKCVKLHEDEGNECDYDQPDYCDGKYLLTCDGNEIRAISCANEILSDDAVCMKINNPNSDSNNQDENGLSATCVLPCSESDANTQQKICIDNRLYLMNCISDENGHYYLDGSYDHYYLPRVNCYHGCDEETNDCIKLHPEEGEICDPGQEFPDKCADNKIYLSCQYSDYDDTTEINYRYHAEDCSELAGRGLFSAFENVSCIEVNTPNQHFMGGCQATCTSAEVGHTMGICDDDYFTGWECIEIASGIYYWSIDMYYCNHGCDDSTNTCITLHEDEGKLCDPADGISICADDFVLRCEVAEYDDDKENYNYRYVVDENCAEPSSSTGLILEFDEYTCVNLPDDFYTSILDTTAACMPKCKASDVDNPQLSCSENNLIGYECVQNDEKYYWWPKFDSCPFGCDKEKLECIKRHEDEGKPCDEGYANGDYKCADNVVLKCEDNVWVYDYACEGIFSCVESDDGSDKFAICSDECLESENGETRYICEDDHFLIQYRCDGDYWNDDDDRYCGHGCDLDNGDCVKIHEDEYQTCSEDESASNYYASRCDGKIYLMCDSWDNKVIAEDCEDLDCDPNLGCFKRKHEDEGKPCNPDAEPGETGYYAMRCDGRVFLWCLDETVVADDCSANACNESLGGCYVPCDEVSDTDISLCLDDYYYGVGYCVEDEDTHIKHLYVHDYDLCDYGCDTTTNTCDEDLSDPDSIIVDYCFHELDTCDHTEHAATISDCIDYENAQRELYQCDPDVQLDHLRYLMVATKQPCGECTDTDYGSYYSVEECTKSWEARLTYLDHMNHTTCSD